MVPPSPGECWYLGTELGKDCLTSPFHPRAGHLAVSEAMYPSLQATFLTSPMPLNVLGVLVPVLGDVLCHPEPAVLSFESLPQITR